MRTVAQILDEKGRSVISVGPEDSIYHALEVMAERDIGALLVMEGDSLVGVFSERDYARKVILIGKSSRDMAVREAMTASVVTVEPDKTIRDCMNLMSDRHIRHLPVVVDGCVEGVISIGDVVHAVITDQEFMIDQLQRYIQS
ncbi:MAG: CBS domain-containing protein [Acidimicrobiia bacterium]